MVFQLTFKTNDVADQLDPSLTESEKDEAMKTMKKFVKWGEYINIRFNTSNKTAEIIPIS